MTAPPRQWKDLADPQERAGLAIVLTVAMGLTALAVHLADVARVPIGVDVLLGGLAVYVGVFAVARWSLGMRWAA